MKAVVSSRLKDDLNVDDTPHRHHLSSGLQHKFWIWCLVDNLEV